MEKCQDVIKESGTGAGGVTQHEEFKASHLKVGEFNVILGCWWLLFLILVHHCSWGAGAKARSMSHLERLSAVSCPIIHSFNSKDVIKNEVVLIIIILQQH
jgi:hypothetical protein